MNVPLFPKHAGVLGSQTQVPDAVPLLTVPVPSICHTDPLSLSAYWTLKVDPFGTGFVGTPMVKVSGSTPLPEPDPFDDVIFAPGLEAPVTQPPLHPPPKATKQAGPTTALPHKR